MSISEASLALDWLEMENCVLGSISVVRMGRAISVKSKSGSIIEFNGRESNSREPAYFARWKDGESSTTCRSDDLDFFGAAFRRTCSIKDDPAPAFSHDNADFRVVNGQVSAEGHLSRGDPDNFIRVMVEIDPNCPFFFDRHEPGPVHVLPDFTGSAVESIVFDGIADAGQRDHGFDADDQDDREKIAQRRAFYGLRRH